MANKHNIAWLGNCPTLTQLEAALKVWGRPADDAYGVMHFNVHGEWYIEGELAVSKDRSVKAVNNEDGAIVSTVVKSTTVISFRISPAEDGVGIGRIETFTGGPGSLKTIFHFLQKAVEGKTEGSVVPTDKPMKMKEIEVNILDLFRQIQDARTNSGGAELVGAKVSRYEVGDKIYGTYSPKFKDSQEGVEFVEKHIDNLKSVQVKVFGFSEKKTVIALTPTASFSIGGKDEEAESVQWFLNELFKTPSTLSSGDDAETDGAGEGEQAA